MRVHGFERAQVAIQKLAHHFAEPGVVLGKTGGVDTVPAFAGGNDPLQQIHLRTFAAAIDSFDGDELAERSSIYSWTQINLIPGIPAAALKSVRQFNRRRSASQRCAC